VKLAFVIKTLSGAGGGAERVLAQVTSGLAGRGHEIHVVTFGSSKDRDFYPIDERANRIWLEAGDVHSRSTVAEVWRRTHALRGAVRTLRPDVAVGFMHSSYVPLALALAGSRVPVVASEHILYDHYRALPVEALALRVTAPLYAGLTVISESIRRSYPKSLARRMHVIPNPVMPATIRASPPDRKSRTLLNVGRLFDQKDQRTLVEAFALIASDYPHWTLRILGEGPLRPMLEQLVEARGLRNRVQLPGVTDDIDGEYRSADLFAMSSRYESFGLATAEALAHGIAAVGFADCPGTNELIQDNVNGLLVQPGDRVAGLADALASLMGNAELRARLANAGPRSITRFSCDAVIAQWDDLLGRCAGRHR
jgi:glycosyltransferase involved in cell wall biosynthesis